MKLLECVPNISEGRDEIVVNQLVEIIRTSKGIDFLDLHVDSDHNRSVITFIGDDESCEKAILRLTEAVIALIDITKHEGEHPYIGSLDVIPFVPLKDTLMETAIETARDCGQAIWTKFKIPVYLYGFAALNLDHQDLSFVRRGGFEALKKEIKFQTRYPDIGYPELHPRAGAAAVGARNFLIAYNINLKTRDIQTTKKIAKLVREKHGGPKGVKAIGIELASRGITQISINITNHRETSLKDVFDAVQSHCDTHGIEIVESELVGLIPKEACFEGMEEYLKMEFFDSSRILESYL